ncbi:MAG: UDP-N-acetylmuramoyl-tripeptide--D-alanyl-D-alanine ligase [Candidatus Omnitrophota bacterium]
MLINDFKQLERLTKPNKIYNIYFFRPLDGFSIDSRSIARGQAFIALRGQHKDGHEFIEQAVQNGASLIIAERFIPTKAHVPFFIVDDTYEAFKRIARYVRLKKNPLVYAVSGSVGKTTTKEMLGFLLSRDSTVLKNYKTENNLLGVGKTIFSLKDEDALILELGTNAAGEIRVLADISQPDIGILTFVKPVHLEGLKTLRGIFEEKTALLKTNPNIRAVLNRDDAYLRKINFCKRAYWFGMHKKDNVLWAHRLKSDLSTATFLVQGRCVLTLATPFEGFIYNALAALSAASLSGRALDDLVRMMNEFRDFPSQRMETKEVNGLIFLNDAYNANPYSFQEALHFVRKYPARKIAIVGDMLELGDRSLYYHTRLAHSIAKSNFEHVLTYGMHAACVKDTLQAIGHGSVHHCDSHQAIADFIKKKARKGDVIFLKGSRRMELEKVVALVS